MLTADRPVILKAQETIDGLNLPHESFVRVDQPGDSARRAAPDSPADVYPMRSELAVMVCS